MKLSICVITMNRANQLKEALESCLACELPQETEFIVIDNASTDNTEQVVHSTLACCGFSYYYEKLPENIGAGAGRNFYFNKATGEYIYGMDDDAVIDTESSSDFFVKAIDILDKNAQIGSLATQVFDVMWGQNRQQIRGAKISDGIYRCLMFCGGSHFLRRNIFTTPPYFANVFGREELPPSLKIYNMGMENAFCPDLVAIHKPLINKWDYSKAEGQLLVITDIAARYSILKMMYPSVCMPFLWIALQIRFFKALNVLRSSKKKLRLEINDICSKYKIEEKIKLSTVFQLARNFGFSAF